MPDLSQRVRQINSVQKTAGKRGRPRKKPLPPTTKVRVPKEEKVKIQDFELETLPSEIKAIKTPTKKLVKKTEEQELQELQARLACIFLGLWIIVGVSLLGLILRLIFSGVL